jgi:agmatine deiminase
MTAGAGARTPRAAGFAMPAEWAPHERTLVCWPARQELWGARIEAARRDYAAVIDAIAAFEPVTVVVDPPQEAEARAALPAERVTVLPIPIDDSWMRDSGPIFVKDVAGARAGVDFKFNAWGEKYPPWDDDARLTKRLLARLGERRLAAPIVLEGGAIAVDGAGTLVTTEQCLLEEYRNPELSRAAIEAALRDWLGVERVVWLGRGLVEDRDTDGHVDNVCAFVEPGRALLQTVPDEADPNWPHARENAARLAAAGIDVVELPWLPRAPGAERPTAVPYTNFYVCNGAVIVPVCGAETDQDALALIGSLHPGREIVGVPGVTLAHGGGGVHCITQQIPA